MGGLPHQQGKMHISLSILDIGQFASTGQDAHKFVYRQVWGLEKKGWLNAEGIGREKRYMQTDLFKGLKFATRSMPVTINRVADVPTVQQGKYNILINDTCMFAKFSIGNALNIQDVNISDMPFKEERGEMKLDNLNWGVSEKKSILQQNLNNDQHNDLKLGRFKQRVLTAFLM
ncbi:hypothetical protein NM211_002684 [Vibrio cholerae]|nr:hypothetical protein [Vibrio cholerae]